MIVPDSGGFGIVRSMRYSRTAGRWARTRSEILVPFFRTWRMMSSWALRASSPQASSPSTVRMLSITVDLPVPRPPTRTLRFGLKWDSGAVEESPLPGERDELGVLLWLQLAFPGIEADARAGVQKGLAQPFGRHL